MWVTESDNQNLQKLLQISRIWNSFRLIRFIVNSGNGQFWKGKCLFWVILVSLFGEWGWAPVSHWVIFLFVAQSHYSKNWKWEPRSWKKNPGLLSHPQCSWWYSCCLLAVAIVMRSHESRVSEMTFSLRMIPSGRHTLWERSCCRFHLWLIKPEMTSASSQKQLSFFPPLMLSLDSLHALRGKQKYNSAARGVQCDFLSVIRGRPEDSGHWIRSFLLPSVKIARIWKF